MNQFQSDASLETPIKLSQLLNSHLDNGLSEEAAKQRLIKEGVNQLSVATALPAWRRFLAQFKDPLVYLLLVSVCVTLTVWFFQKEETWPVDALVISFIVFLNAILGFMQETRSQRAAAILSHLTQELVSVRREGIAKKIPSYELVRGDLLILSEGEKVGADARLVQANSLKIQESSLTGESEAVQKRINILTEIHPLAERCNMVYKGTSVVQGTGLAIVTATGMNTEVGMIAHLLESTAEEITPLQKEVREIGHFLGKTILVIAVMVVVTISFLTDIKTIDDLINTLLLGVSLAVAAVPEGLPAVLSLVLAVGVQRMAKHNAIVKKQSSVETLGSTSIICTDKTGTLTRAEMTIERAITASGDSQFSGIGYVPKGEVRNTNSQEPLTNGALYDENYLLITYGILASNAELQENEPGNWTVQGDPTEAAFLVAGYKLGGYAKYTSQFERFAEIPFTSERKMMSVAVLSRINTNGNNAALLISKGAPDVLLNHCSHWQIGKQFILLTELMRSQILASVENLSNAALRTLSVAYRPLQKDELIHINEEAEQKLIFIGTVGIIDPPRLEAAEAIREAQKAGVRIIMITGDHPRTALRVASDLGITSNDIPVLSGTELQQLDGASLAKAVQTVSVYARVAPIHKLRIVDALQAQGHIVAMTGDGVNDAPALKSADIGVAMGITGTEVTKEAGKMILADDNFTTLIVAIREGRGILDNIRKFLRYLLSSNAGEVLSVFMAIIFSSAIGLVDDNGFILLPLLATQLLWVNLITDAAPALAMGIDPIDKSVMQRKPRKISDRIIDVRMWSGVLQTGFIMAIITLFALDWSLPNGFINGNSSIETARTTAFTVLVFSQLFNVFNSRSETISFFHGLFDNFWLWCAVILGIFLQILVVHSSFLNSAFNTVPLSIEQWIMCILLASMVLIYGEVRKLFLRLKDTNL